MTANTPFSRATVAPRGGSHYRALDWVKQLATTDDPRCAGPRVAPPRLRRRRWIQPLSRERHLWLTTLGMHVMLYKLVCVTKDLPVGAPNITALHDAVNADIGAIPPDPPGLGAAGQGAGAGAHAGRPGRRSAGVRRQIRVGRGLGG